MIRRMSSTCSAYAGVSAPGCCSSRAWRRKRGSPTSAANENGSGMSRPRSVVRAGRRRSGEGRVDRAAAEPGPAHAQVDAPRVQRRQGAERLGHLERAVVRQQDPARADTNGRGRPRHRADEDPGAVAASDRVPWCCHHRGRASGCSRRRWRPATSRTDQVRGRLDAVLIASRVAPVTSHIGLVPDDRRSPTPSRSTWRPPSPPSTT